MAERRQQKRLRSFFVPLARFDGIDSRNRLSYDDGSADDDRSAPGVVGANIDVGAGRGDRGCAQGAQAWPMLWWPAKAGGFRLGGRRTPKAAQRHAARILLQRKQVKPWQSFFTSCQQTAQSTGHSSTETAACCSDGGGYAMDRLSGRPHCVRSAVLAC